MSENRFTTDTDLERRAVREENFCVPLSNDLGSTRCVWKNQVFAIHISSYSPPFESIFNCEWISKHFYFFIKDQQKTFLDSNDERRARV